MISRCVHVARLSDLCAVITLCLIASCATRLPTYPSMPPEDALAAITARAESVRTFSAECDVTLVNAEGESVSLDGAIVAEPPSRLRMRAWKFGRAVLDITVKDGAVWIASSSDPETREHTDISADFTGDQIRRGIALLGPEFLRHASVDSERTTQNVLTIRGSDSDKGTLLCTIDRATLTIRRFESIDDAQQGHGGVFTLKEYRLVDGIPWPTELRFESPQGRIVVRLRAVNLNTPVQDAAFVPPRRAIQQP